MAYHLTITEDEAHTIAFVGHRYAWSLALCALGPGHHTLSESEAWELSFAFDQDTEGGHSYFPMLDPASELYRKLLHLQGTIV